MSIKSPTSLALLMRGVAADRALTDATVKAQSIAPVVATGEREALTLTLEQTQSGGEYPITVFLPDGTVIGTRTPREPAVDLAARGRSLSVTTGGGRAVYVAVQGGPGGTAVIRTFVTDARLRRGVTRAWTVLGLTGAGLLVLGLIVADRLARSLTRPISALAAVSNRLAHGDLDARIRPAGRPEIHEVGTGLNHLADRIRELLAAEREAAADLSHRLRTPLTSLRLETESLTDPAEGDRVGAAVDALERTVTQIIAETRRPARGQAASCDATEVIARRTAFWSVLAEEQDRALDVTVPDHPMPVAVAEDALTACVDALTGNVLAHTPEGTAFAVRLEDGRLTVEDDGPGIGDPRPHRGHSTAASSGLGLDIARRTAEASAGSLEIGSSSAGGARVALMFGGSSRR